MQMPDLPFLWWSSAVSVLKAWYLPGKKKLFSVLRSRITGVCGLNPDFKRKMLIFIRISSASLPDWVSHPTKGLVFQTSSHTLLGFQSFKLYFLNCASCWKISAINCSKKVALKERGDIEIKLTTWDGKCLIFLQLNTYILHPGKEKGVFLIIGTSVTK